MMNQEETPKPVILMVDDTPANLHVLFDLLSESGFEVLLADAHWRMGQTSAGLALLTEARAFVETTGERLYETELYRLKGELTLQRANQKSKIKNTQPPAPNT